MSNFSSLAQVDGTLNGTAPAIFCASTPDSLVTITAAGYLNDVIKKFKANDLVFVNYSDASAFPLYNGEASVFGAFSVIYNPSSGNMSLQQQSFPSGLSIIANLGVHSALYTNAGGSATTVVSDSRISNTNKILARWKSSANAVTVEKVTPANGSFTVLSSGDPGASVLEYIAITPSTLLLNSGVEAYGYSYEGGSATFTVTDSNITATSVINANFKTSANAVNIQKITPAAGSFTVLCSGDPGVSVLDYVSVIPSVALTANGLYGATYTNAGGSATTTITDANILAGSVVSANWATSANAVNIEKVTASAGTLTILSSGDPGASTLNYIATPAAE